MTIYDAAKLCAELGGVMYRKTNNKIIAVRPTKLKDCYFVSIDDWDNGKRPSPHWAPTSDDLISFDWAYADGICSIDKKAPCAQSGKEQNY